MPIKPPVGDHPLKREFTQAILWADANRGRSLQRTIGPSELGNPCMRRLAYSLAGTEPANLTQDTWFPIIGTAVHAWLAEAMNDYQTRVLGRDPLRDPRWIIEQQVFTGDPLCPSGHGDLYDCDFETNVDWKIVGPTTLKKVKTTGISHEYRVQAHTYGKGWKRAGRDVRQVMVVFLPRNAPLSQTFIWVEDFDEKVADAALGRLRAIDQIRRQMQIEKVPTADGCTWCPYYRPHTPTDLAGCAGHGR